MELPTFSFAVESLFTMPGAWLINGTQKAGKSLLAMQAALSLNAHVPFLDRYECKIEAPCPVLVLEQDDPSQLAAVQLILKRTEIPFDPDSFYSVEKAAFCIEQLFIEYLEQRIAAEGLKVIVLDSYTAMRAPRRAGCDLVKVESAELQLLDSLAKRTNTLILLIHHTSRGHAGLDWSEKASGSFAVGAAVEGQLYIERYPELPATAPERLIRIQARHLSGIEMTVRLDERTLNYDFVLDGAAAPYFPMLQRIHEEFGVGTFSPKSLAFCTGLARASVHRLIARLLAGKVAAKAGHGEYKLNAFLRL